MAERLKILVVDDDDSTRDYVCSLLAARAYQAVSAASAEDGLDRLKESPPPAVILVDLIMPGMDGLAFLEEVRQRRHCTSLTVFPITQKPMTRQLRRPRR